MENLEKLINSSDIRGVALGENANLTPEAAYALGVGFGRFLIENNINRRVAIGSDPRISGEAIKNAFSSGLISTGAEVFDGGLTSTPAMFFAIKNLGVGASVMITASHLPMDRNGLKFFTKDGGLDNKDIKRIVELASSEKSPLPSALSPLAAVDIMNPYSDSLVRKCRKATGHEKPLFGRKIIVDAGNGSGGFFVDKVLIPLGADTSGSQFLNPDGTFPNHAPNPEDDTAMRFIIDATLYCNADLGIIFDTDVDRAGAVDGQGQPINKNRLIALISAIVLEEEPETTIVTDSITSDGLTEFIEAHGGVHRRFKRGYKNVINECKRLNESGIKSAVAIETSGHCALRENDYLDDGAYLIVKLLTKLALHSGNISELTSSLVEAAYELEFRLKIDSPDFKTIGQAALADLEKIISTDPSYSPYPENHEGVRARYKDGWFLARLSLHDPLIAINCEAENEQTINEMKAFLTNFFKGYF